MITIERALEEFLSEQEQRLKPRTYDEYEEVIYFFKWYLHGFTYVYLNEEDRKYYDGLCDKKGYCEIFGTEYIRAIGMRSFFGDFITRKGPCSKTFMKTVGRVMPELLNWLHEKGYTADEEYNQINNIIKEFKDEL
jgi:thymidylate synthase